jgi:transcriptional regulator with XRE-family HTH domain/quercetin dioxygenase-like cupin family protein
MRLEVSYLWTEECLWCKLVKNMDNSLGTRLKERRQQYGLSLRELARRTDLTASFLSQVERGKTSVSLDSLRRIAEALEVPMLYFLTDSEAAIRQPPDPKDDQLETNVYSPVVRADARPRLILPISGVVYEKLIPDFGRKMEAFLGQLSPGTGNVARRLRKPTEELIFVISGVLLVELSQGIYLLKSGDSIYFEGESLHRLECASQTEDANWISVITPAVF